MPLGKVNIWTTMIHSGSKVFIMIFDNYNMVNMTVFVKELHWQFNQVMVK